MRNITLNSIARAVLYNDHTLARNLLSRSDIAKDFLRCDRECVYIHDPERYADLVEESKRRYYEEKRDRLDKELESAPGKQSNSQSKNRNRANALARLAQAWTMLDKRIAAFSLRLKGGARDVEDIIVRSPEVKAKALATAWGPTFAKRRSIDDVAVHSFLTRWASKFDFRCMAPPELLDFERFLRLAKDSATGPDGLPYSAWRAAGVAGAQTLYLLYLFLADGLNPPLHFNNSFTVFTPKGEQRQDLIEVIRAPEETRPLGLKNSDNKTIAGVINNCSKPMLSRSACHLQRGFVPQRQLVHNVLDVDTAARIFGAAGHHEFGENESAQDFSSPPAGKLQVASAKGKDHHTLLRPSLCPVIALFDYAAAFPSVIHAWIMLVLEGIGAPQVFIALIKGFYFWCRTATSIAGQVHFLFLILSGVLQGCPLSGMIFAIAIDPFLRYIDASIDLKGLGMTRACADDIAVALASLAGLADLLPCFTSTENLAGLCLKPKKCIIIPCGKVLTDHLRAEIKRWLAQHLPTWKDFNVQKVGKYLGFLVGPCAGDAQWTAAISKYR
jgi:hypothetical protein